MQRLRIGRPQLAPEARGLNIIIIAFKGFTKPSPGGQDRSKIVFLVEKATFSSLLADIAGNAFSAPVCGAVMVAALCGSAVSF